MPSIAERPRRRILEEIQVDRIAAVDNPAQEHARVTILKRAPEPETTSKDVIAKLEEIVSSLEKRKGDRKKERGMDADLAVLAEEGKEVRDDQDDDEAADDEIPRKGRVKKRHRFEAFVERIAREEKVPRTIAMTRARQQYPELYASYLQDNKVSKSYEDLVQAEIRKGCSPVVAAQRVAMLYPDAARASITKAKDEAADFTERVGAYQTEHSCARTVAMSEIRKRYPDAFERLQNG